MAQTQKIQLIVDAENKTKSAMNSVNKSLDTVQKKLEKLQPAFKKMAIAGVAATAAIGVGIKKTVTSALEFEQIEESFARMTKKMGMDGDELVKGLQDSSADTVSVFNLMLSSNKAMALGVGENMEDITTLMEIARLKGRALGLDTTQAFNDIVTGIGRGSPLILDNLGITIKIAEAQRIYAEQLGKTTEELTDAEKKNAIFNAVMVSGKKELKEAGELVLTNKEKMQQLTASIADTSVKIGLIFLPMLDKLLAKVLPIVETVKEWIEENPKLTLAIIIIVGAVAGLVAIIGTLGLLLPGIIILFGAITSPILLVITTLVLLGATIAYIALKWDQHVDNMKWAFAIFKESIGAVVDWIKDKFGAFVSWIDDKVQAVIDSVKRAISAVASIPGVGAVTGAVKAAGGVVSKVWDFVTPRQHGGPVTAGGSYLVGERGPELFTPGQYGKISGAGGSNITINIQGNEFLGEEGIAERIGNSIMQSLKNTVKL